MVESSAEMSTVDFHSSMPDTEPPLEKTMCSRNTCDEFGGEC